MKGVIRATVLVLAVTIALGTMYLAVDMLWLGHIEPKFGGRWDNFVLGMQLLSVGALMESVVFGVLALVSARWLPIRGLSIFLAAVTMALATIRFWPRQRPLITAVAIAAVAFGIAAVPALIAKASRRKAVA